MQESFIIDRTTKKKFTISQNFFLATSTIKGNRTFCRQRGRKN